MGPGGAGRGWSSELSLLSMMDGGLDHGRHYFRAHLALRFAFPCLAPLARQWRSRNNLFRWKVCGQMGVDRKWALFDESRRVTATPRDVLSSQFASQLNTGQALSPVQQLAWTPQHPPAAPSQHPAAALFRAPLAAAAGKPLCFRRASKTKPTHYSACAMQPTEPVHTAKRVLAKLLGFIVCRNDRHILAMSGGARSAPFPFLPSRLSPRLNSWPRLPRKGWSFLWQHRASERGGLRLCCHKVVLIPNYKQ